MSDDHNFHELIGKRNRRMVYKKSDFLDYTIMLLLSAAVCGFVFGWLSPFAIAAYALCCFMFVYCYATDQLMSIAMLCYIICYDMRLLSAHVILEYSISLVK